MPNNKTFKEAFREAKNTGKKTFMWNNKSYHTRTKEEEQRKDLEKTHTKRKKVINKWETWDKKRNGGFLLPPWEENID